MSLAESDNKFEAKVGGAEAIKISNLSITKGDQTILDNASFSLRTGESSAIIGPNGIGKTILLRAILGEELLDSGTIQTLSGFSYGYIPQSIEGIDFDASRSIFEYLQYSKGLDRISNDMIEIERRFSQGDVCEQDLENYGRLQSEFELRGGWTLEIDANKIFTGLGISHLQMGQRLSVLSGGEKTKLFIAQTLLKSPDILLLDEPTNHLDRNSIDWFADYLRDYPDSVLVISHDARFLELFVDNILEFSPFDHTVSEYRGGYISYLEQRDLQLKVEEKTRDKYEEEVARLTDTINRLRGGGKAKMAKDRKKKLGRLTPVEKKPKTQKPINLRFEIANLGNLEVLAVKGLRKKYGKTELNYEDLDLLVTRGEKIAIIGPLGAGKSSLLKIIVGKIPPDSGDIKIGDSINIGYYDQELSGLSGNKTVIQELSSSAQSIPEGKIRSVLGHFLFSGNSVNKRVSVLSHGERARLILAKLVLGNHNFLVLDEPTNHLDSISKQRLVEALKDYPGTLLIVSHDTEFLEQLNLDKLLHLPGGRTEILKI